MVATGRANAIAAILDSKRRGRLGRVERATKILQIQHGGYDQPRFWHSRFPGKLACIAGYVVTGPNFMVGF